MSLEHKCRVCGHRWKSPAASAARDVEAAGKSQGGPLCGLCYHLEMANRYAEHRGDTLAAAVERRARR